MDEIIEGAEIGIQFGDNFIDEICSHLGFTLKLDGLTLKCRSSEEYLEKCRMLGKVTGRYCHRLLNDCPTSYFKWTQGKRSLNLIIICAAKGASKSYNEIISIDYVIDHRACNYPSVKPLSYLNDIFQQLPKFAVDICEEIDSDDVITNCLSFNTPYDGNIKGVMLINVFIYSLESSIQYMKVHGDIITVNNDFFAPEHHSNIFQYR